MTAPTFDAGFQNKIMTLTLRDATFLQRCEGLLKPAYFDEEPQRYLINLANDHYATYRTTLDPKIVIKTIKDAKAAKKLKSDFVDDLKPFIQLAFGPSADLSNRDFYVEEVSKFARHRAMEEALTFSIDVYEKGGDFAEIDAKIREAQSVGAHDGIASRDLFADLGDRVRTRIAKLGSPGSRGITTGHREIDDLLYHKGWGKKELALLLGGAKSGKSTGLAHFAIKAVEAGYKVLYTTHENSADVALDRIDCAISGVAMRDLDVSGTTVTAELTAFEARSKGGLLKVEEFPAGEASVADLKRLVSRYAAQGIKFDLLVCDYADELKPSRRFNDERFALKDIYTSLRALAQNEDIAVLTATQTNRQGNKATTAVATDVGEDWSKVKIADVVISINATEEERKLNQMRLYLAAMRNSEGGLTIHCAIDRAKMRFITKVLKVT